MKAQSRLPTLQPGRRADANSPKMSTSRRKTERKREREREKLTRESEREGKEDGWETGTAGGRQPAHTDGPARGRPLPARQERLLTPKVPRATSLQAVSDALPGSSAAPAALSTPDTSPQDAVAFRRSEPGCRATARHRHGGKGEEGCPTKKSPKLSRVSVWRGRVGRGDSQRKNVAPPLQGLLRKCDQSPPLKGVSTLMNAVRTRLATALRVTSPKRSESDPHACCSATHREFAASVCSRSALL